LLFEFKEQTVKQSDWAWKTKRFLIDLTSILLLILTIVAVLWEHIRHLFR
jgi:hypothetical protein